LRLLLDTNVLLWALTNPQRLSAAAAEAIEDIENRVYLSVVSPWELSIKASLGNLPALEDLGPKLDEMHCDLLPIALPHAKAIQSLPHHHRDPFDRMLVAQAQIEGLTIVTSDRQIRRYQVAVLPAR
jgi:PIN domain nuclease of toxin-antitoxin system